MKFIRKSAEYIGYMFCHGEKIIDWMCPNEKCGMHISEDYVCCPYCGQKVKFEEPLKVKMVRISAKVGEVTNNE